MRLNIITLLGLLLLAAGVAFLLGVSIPRSETVFEVGALSASVETRRSVSPVISWVLAALGIAAVTVGQMAGRSNS